MKRSGIIALICALAVLLAGCGARVQASDLMEGVHAAAVSGKAADDEFIRSQMRFSVELFRASAKEKSDENLLISPLSLQLALAMTANGADGDTKAEMETLLGGEFSIEELNEYLYSYVKSLPSEKKYRFEIANSIWFRDTDISVKPEFLQANADYYGAEIYKSPFDAQTVKDINNWVDVHTDGMIDRVIDKIKTDTVMYLVNALVFDAAWEQGYTASDVYDGNFWAIGGEKRAVRMMHSEESTYLSDGCATGFIKKYKDGKYSFAALLPNEDIDIRDYIAGLTADGLQNTLQQASDSEVSATLPKFSYEYSQSMVDVLKALGMPSAFSGQAADFTKMADITQGEICIDDVLHKTFISVDEQGTKAGAASVVQMNKTSAYIPNTVTLDRPFVYMVIDNATGLPIFLGAAMDIGE